MISKIKESSFGTEHFKQYYCRINFPACESCVQTYRKIPGKSDCPLGVSFQYWTRTTHGDSRRMLMPRGRFESVNAYARVETWVHGIHELSIMHKVNEPLSLNFRCCILTSRCTISYRALNRSKNDYASSTCACKARACFTSSTRGTYLPKPLLFERSSVLFDFRIETPMFHIPRVYLS